MDLEDIKARAEAATPPPWRTGWPSFACTLDHGVNGGNGGHGTAKCRYLFRGWLDDAHAIGQDRLTAASVSDDAVQIAGNYDYDVGGIVKPTDADFIAHARQDIPDLLAALDVAQDRIARLEGAITRALAGCPFCKRGQCRADAHHWLADALAPTETAP